VDSAFEGYNATVIAYGQTGTGKTYSMEGIVNSQEKKGIIPRMVDYIFDKISQSTEKKEYKLKCSMIQIYLEDISDLLNKGNNKLAVITHPILGKIVKGATEEYVNNPDTMLKFMQRGSENRVTAETQMNATSSRSHSIFIVTIEQKDLDTEITKLGKLYMVDLAGSEKVSKTGTTGQTLKEGSSINKSLTTLGIVMNCLVTNAKHIPYRDSQLTNLLSDALGGNSNTAMIINCSPSSFNASETFSTLEFGQRAKMVRLKPKANTYKSPQQLDKENKTLLTIMQQIFSELKKKDGLKESSTKALKLMEKGDFETLLVEVSKGKDGTAAQVEPQGVSSEITPNKEKEIPKEIHDAPLKSEPSVSNEKLFSILNKWKEDEKKYKKQIEVLLGFKNNANSNFMYMKEVVTKLKEVQVSIEFDIKNKGFTSEKDIDTTLKYIELLNSRILESIENSVQPITESKVAQLECFLIESQQSVKEKEKDMLQLNSKLKEMEDQRDKDIKELSKMKQHIKVITDDSCDKNNVIMNLTDNVVKGGKGADIIGKISEITELKKLNMELKKENTQIKTRNIEYEKIIKCLKIANNKNQELMIDIVHQETKESSISGSPRHKSECGDGLKTPRDCPSKKTKFVNVNNFFQPPPPVYQSQIVMPIIGGSKPKSDSKVDLSHLLDKLSQKSRTSTVGRSHCNTETKSGMD
jgi:kinesin family protein 5